MMAWEDQPEAMARKRVAGDALDAIERERERTGERIERIAPSDAECAKAWEQIMAIASEHCLIVQAYGGVATLAMPEEQRAAGVRELALRCQLAGECQTG